MIKGIKKGIGPVVTVSLIVVIAVTSVVALQTWYTSYQGDLFAEVESQNIDSVSIDYFDSLTVMVRNSNVEDVNLTDIRIGSVSCSVNATLTAGETSVLPLGNCNSTLQVGPQDVVLITDSGLVTKEFFVRSVGFSSTNGSSSSYTGSFNGYAYNSHLGYISFNGSNYGVNVSSDSLYGYAYSEHYGYISFNGSNYGVNITDDVLHGYAYGEHIGFINFNNSPTYQVTINGTNLQGYAYSEHYGYIHFTYSTFYDVFFS